MPVGGDAADWWKHVEFSAGANEAEIFSPKVYKMPSTYFMRQTLVYIYISC